MGNLILESSKNGIKIKDVYKTAEFLYELYYPFEIIEQYQKYKYDDLLKEEWPYDIDQNTFVDNFNFNYGEVLNRNNDSKGEKCLSFISNRITKNQIICVGYYGLGKTTISKMLFNNWNYDFSGVYPVYITLTHRSLKDFRSENLGKEIANGIITTLSQINSVSERYNSYEIIEKELFDKNIYRMVENRKILLIFDGIDESKCDRGELLNFLNEIFENNFLVFITCRLEYSPFFDAYQSLIIKKYNHICIELSEWKKPQWTTYISGLIQKYPLKKELIEKFDNRLNSEIYSTLPGRPLFLKMLSDLEINNETGISIDPKVSTNLAEIYFKFIKWKVRDDYRRKGGVYDLDLKKFEEECFELLRNIAILEYNSSFKNSSEVTLRSIQKICQEKQFIQLTDKYIVEVLLKSSLFAILRRTDDERYTFSHRSFMEYLVAFDLAYCIFPENMNINNAICDDIWRSFQTHEVCNHFVNEVERVQITNNLDIKKRNEVILSAFKKIINTEIKKNLLEFDERFEGVLYHVGKLKIESTELIDILKIIINNKDKYHPIYFRTASLALSRLLGAEFCEKYVLSIIKDSKHNQQDFKINQDIQRRYYGEATLRKVLENDINEYISKRNTSSIISLKIFSYFTGVPIKKEEFEKLKNYLNKVYNMAIEQEDTNIQKICEEIKNMLSNQPCIIELK